MSTSLTTLEPDSSRRGQPLLPMLFALFFVSVVACAPRPNWIARVGDETITTRDVIEAARTTGGLYSGAADSAKALLLDDLVRRSLLIQEAKRRHLIGEERLTVARRDIEAEILTGTLLERMTPRNIPVSDAEVRRLYEWRGIESQLQVIFSADRGRVDAAREELDRGADFAAVADRYNLPGLLPPGGVLRFLAPGSLVNPLDDYLRESPPGEIHGPFETPGEGWFIVRVIERRPRPQEPFELQEFALREILRQRKWRTLSTRVYRDLRAAYRIQVDPEGPHVLFDRYNDPRLSQGQSLPDPGPVELARVLARYDGGPGGRGVYTLADAFEDLDHGRGDPPSASILPSFRAWIESRVTDRVLVLEARRQRLDQEPAIARRVRERLNELLLDTIHEVEVIQRSRILGEDIGAAYERHAARLARLEWAVIQHMMLPDSAGAVTVLEHARRAGSLKDAILLASSGLQVREEQVLDPAEDPFWGPHRARLLATPIGGYGSPTRVGDRWLVFQVLSKQQTSPPIESLDFESQEAIRKDAAELARERRLIELCDSLRTTYTVRENRQALARLPWPVEPVRGSGG